MADFYKNVNAASVAIAKMTEDPAERLGIVSVLMEMYKYEVQQAFTSIDHNKPAANAS